MRAVLLGPIKAARHVQENLFRSFKIRSDDFLIGIDGGLQRWKEWGVEPHFGVGDWDSLLQKKLLKNIPHVSLPRTKKRSDLFYSVIAALTAGVDELLCVGVTGGRMDHHLGALYDLSLFSTGKFGFLKSICAKGLEGDYHFLSEKIPSWKGVFPKHTLVSVFGMNQGASGVTLSGFRYTMRGGRMTLSSLGLSNRTLRKHCKVSLSKGQLVIIIPRFGVGTEVDHDGA